MTISDIRKKQVPKIIDMPRLVTISASANDIQLANILNSCIYNWYKFNPLALLKDCDQAIADPLKTPDSKELTGNLQDLLKETFPKMDPEGMILCPIL